MRAWSIDRRKSFGRHHQCPRSWRPIRAPHQGAAGQPLTWGRSSQVITDVHNMGSSIGSNPGSKPDCVTRLIAELDQPHIRSPLIAAAPISRLRQAGLRTTRPFYDTAFRQGIARFVDLDPPGLIRPGRFLRKLESSGLHDNTWDDDTRGHILPEG